jgi:hypothetical protein
MMFEIDPSEEIMLLWSIFLPPSTDGIFPKD